MPWFKVDDNLGFHHKVIAAGNPAMGLWVRAGAICAQQLMDGFVPDHMATTLGTRGQAQRLVAAGLWEAVQGGYRFHEWADRQPSKVSVEAERASAANRMRERRAQRKTGDRKAPSQVSDLRSPEHDPNEQRTSSEVRGVFGDPDPTQSQSRPDLLKELPGTAVAVPVRSDVDRLCEHLARRVCEDGSKRPAITQKWRDAARLLIDKDGRSEQQVHNAIDWSQDHHFWRSNIMSMPTLRAQYDRLRKVADDERAKSPGQDMTGLINRAAQRMGITEGEPS